MNLSFAGCGFLGIYHVGVAVAFKQYAPHLLLEKIGGASAGALAATCLLCDMPLGELTSDFFRVVNEARSHKLKAFSPSFNIQNCLLEGLEKFLPVNAHELVNGKLHISLTRFWGRKNVIVSHFDSREELLQALLCACWIPVFSGYVPPKFRGVSYMDGAFSDNLPVLDENTVTVSPFCGESDICPRDDSAQLFHVNLANTSIEVSLENMGRLRRILVPCLPEELSDMCQQGFDDALQFLHRNDLISCTRCLAVQSTFVVQERIHDPRTKKHFDPKCVECVRHRMEVLDGNKMPETVLTVFQTYIENANIGLAKWIFRNRGWRLLETLSLPATVPADMICATLTKILLMTNNIVSIVGDSMERRQMEMWVLSNYINQSQPVMPLHAHRHRYLADADADGDAAMRTRLDWLLRHWSRLLATTPCLRERFWHLADFLIDQINALNSIVQTQRTQKMSANISCQLSLTECGQQKVKNLTHRSSKLDILINDNEIVSTIDRQLPQHQQQNAAVTSPLVSSTTFPDNHQHQHHHHHHHHQQQQQSHSHHHQHSNAHGDVDSFDHILQTTSHHEAVYAYYYMDENHKVKVTEIFDMTDNEDTDLQTITERVLNQQLQFDASDWDARPTADYLPGESALGGDGDLDAGGRSQHQQSHHHHHAQSDRQQHAAQPVSSAASAANSSSYLSRSSSTVRSNNHNINSNNGNRRRTSELNCSDDDDDDSNDYSSTMSVHQSAAQETSTSHQPEALHPTANYYTDLMEEDDIDGFLFRPATPASEDDDDDDELSVHNNCSSDPEVDQQTRAAAAAAAAARRAQKPEAAAGMQISEQANQALSRASQLHLHLF